MMSGGVFALVSPDHLERGVHQPKLNPGLDALLLPVQIELLLLDAVQFVDGGTEGFNQIQLESANDGRVA